MIERTESVIVDIVSKAVAPFIQIFALYIITHGHYSPGGGFQGGALFAASLLLLRLTIGRECSEGIFPIALGTPISSLGVFLFGIIGAFALIGGGLYLDYAALPWQDLSPPDRRSLGILLVEIGVGLGVTGTLVAIFDDLVGKQKNG